MSLQKLFLFLRVLLNRTPPTTTIITTTTIETTQGSLQEEKGWIALSWRVEDENTGPGWWIYF